jgi:hypothetical protein
MHLGTQIMFRKFFQILIKENECFIISANQGLLRDTPQRKSFEKDGKQMTIQQYYAKVHNVQLQYPGLPW